MQFQRTLAGLALIAALAAAGCSGGSSGLGAGITPPSATTPPIAPQTEKTYYNGTLVNWVIPGTDNSHQQFLGCFPAGPAVSSPFPTGVLYAIQVPGATMHVCPNNSDPTQTHDHIMQNMPGIAINPTVWEVWGVGPGPNYTPSILPIKTMAALNTAVNNAQLVIYPWDGSLIDGIIQP